MKDTTKAYFVSDLHLGAKFLLDNTVREKKFVSWLDKVSKDATHIFLLGDIFDYWFEYKEVIPKGFVRTLGKLAELSDNGIKLHFFAGNHDQWSFGYLEKEIGLQYHLDEFIITLGNKKFYLHHGDGLGNFEKNYNRLKKLFRNKTLQWLFKGIHPNLSMRIAHKWSASSRLGKENYIKKFLGEDKEYQILFAKEILKNEHFDFFIFGHRHLPFDITLENNTRVISLGDWVTHFNFAIFDGDKLTINKVK